MEAIIEPRRRAPVPKETRSALMKRAGRRCEKCRTSRNLTIHHIDPVSNEGSNDLDNLSLLCKSCHLEWERFMIKHDEVAFADWVTWPPADVVAIMLYAPMEFPGDREQIDRLTVAEFRLRMQMEIEKLGALADGI